MGKKNNIRYEAIKKMLDLAYENKDTVLQEGQKVKLNYQRIISESDYKFKQKKYKEFIEVNKDKEFTVQYDEYHQNGKLVCLKEDNSEPKWLFTFYDLVPIAPILTPKLSKEDIIKRKIERAQKRMLLEAGEKYEENF